MENNISPQAVSVPDRSNDTSHQSQLTVSSSSRDARSSQVNHDHVDRASAVCPPIRAAEPSHPFSVYVNMPTSPSGLHIVKSRRSISCNGEKLRTRISSMSSSDRRFDPFKTWSGKLERQISNFRGIRHEPDVEADGPKVATEAQRAPEVDRYYDALQGPELDTLRPSEVSVLPDDERWPFLLRFQISSFGVCLGVGSQAILWKSMAQHKSLLLPPHVCLTIDLVLWCISVALMLAVSIVYSMKVIVYFEAVRREYHHPVRVNFFFAPWIACLVLALGLPPTVAANISHGMWYALMAPILCLELKIYGQWMSGGKNRLSRVANPSNHLAIVGNFVGALLGANIGLREGPIFFFAVGLAHYIVLFVTLYQRLPSNDTLPKDLHPVFFLFVAAPAIACIAWEKIDGDFGYGSKIAYFVTLFLYVSLAVRINFFRGVRFSLAWWAYTFPMTGSAIATIRYSMKVSNWFTKSLAIGLSGIAAFTVLALFVATVIHAFVLHTLFPNDIAIAIAGKRPPSRKEHKRLRSATPDSNHSEASSGRRVAPIDQ